MKIDWRDIEDCDVGRFFWICDYHREFPKKPHRNVEPQKVLFDKEKLGSSYQYFFRALKKNGSPSSKKIKPHGNTYPSRVVSIFTDEDECRAAFKDYVLGAQIEAEQYVRHYNSEIDTMKEMVKEQSHILKEMYCQ